MASVQLASHDAGDFSVNSSSPARTHGDLSEGGLRTIFPLMDSRQLVRITKCKLEYTDELIPKCPFIEQAAPRPPMKQDI